METIFDQALVASNRQRALKQATDGADFLLERIGAELADRLALVERHFDLAVELHGATGRAGDLARATGKIDALQRLDLTTGDDLDVVPLEPASTGLIVAPASLHLVNDLPGLLIQLRRALRPDGLLLAAIPGAGTLAELRDVLLAAEAELTGGAHPRIIPFADVRDVGGLLQRAGFALPVVDVDSFTVRYDSAFHLMRDLRAMGMANPLAARSRRPVTRAFFLRVAELYAERHADADGRIRATFSMIYVSGWAPHESQQKPLKPGSARLSLAEALNDRSTPKA